MTNKQTPVINIIVMLMWKPALRRG